MLFPAFPGIELEVQLTEAREAGPGEEMRVAALEKQLELAFEIGGGWWALIRVAGL